MCCKPPEEYPLQHHRAEGMCLMCCVTSGTMDHVSLMRLWICRKFDIRQWVLVTNSAPMTAWFYQECYLRFCAEDYSLSDLTNVFSHLSNNCIARKSLHFESGVLLSTAAVWFCCYNEPSEPHVMSSPKQHKMLTSSCHSCGNVTASGAYKQC